MIRNVVLYILTLMGFVWFSIMYNMYQTSLLLLAWIIFPLFLFLLLLYSRSKVKLNIDINQKNIRVDDEFDLILHISNKGVIPITRMDILIEYTNTYTGDKKKEVIRFTMDKKNEQMIKTAAKIEICGIFNFKIASIQIYDFLELFSIKKKLKNEMKIICLPKHIELPLDSIPIIGHVIAEEGEVVQKKGDDPSEVFGIRDYIDGDRESRVHHKLSFKYNTVMIKE